MAMHKRIDTARRISHRWPLPLVVIGLFVFPGSPVAFAAASQYVAKQPAGTLHYKIVLSGDFDGGSATGTPVKQQWHDIIHIHRAIEVTSTMFRVPAATGPDCGKACGDDWSGAALEALQRRVHERCKDNYARGAKMIAEGTHAITVLANLQSLAAKGPTWATMAPCTATATVNDTETLTRYIHADETDDPAGKDPGLATRKGSVSGQVNGANCSRLRLRLRDLSFRTAGRQGLCIADSAVRGSGRNRARRRIGSRKRSSCRFRIA